MAADPSTTAIVVGCSAAVVAMLTAIATLMFRRGKSRRALDAEAQARSSLSMQYVYVEAHGSGAPTAVAVVPSRPAPVAPVAEPEAAPSSAVGRPSDNHGRAPGSPRRWLELRDEPKAGSGVKVGGDQLPPAPTMVVEVEVTSAGLGLVLGARPDDGAVVVRRLVAGATWASPGDTPIEPGDQLVSAGGIPLEGIGLERARAALGLAASCASRTKSAKLRLEIRRFHR